VFLVLCATSHAYTFASMGDWGNQKDDHAFQKAVAASMAQQLPQYNTSWVLAVGDNFYPDGVEGLDDEQWQDTYTNIYTDPAFNVPFYVVAGNHDWHAVSGPQPQIDWYTQKKDNRWFYPSLFYTVTFPVNNNQTLQVVFLDTVSLCPDCTLRTIEHGIQEGEMDSWVLAQFYANLPLVHRLRADQWTWIEQTLANSTADWLIVTGHFPVYSGGGHGDQPELIDRLEPMLDQYNVDAYICGHDHDLQHLQNGPVNFWVSGSASKKSKYDPTPQAVWGVVELGFMTHTLAQEAMTTRAIDTTGTTLYQYTQPRRAKPHDSSLIVE